MNTNPRAESDKAQGAMEEPSPHLESEGPHGHVKKLDTVGQLAGGVAQYLNGVLTVIKDFPVPVAAPTPAVSPVPDVFLHPGQKTILVVEDEPDLRQLVAEVLNDHGYRVLEAANGVEALGVWRLHRDQIDLLLTDIVLPEGITGPVLAQRLKAEQPQLRVLYTSGHGDTTPLMELNLREGINYLQKPYLPSRMLHTVGVCLENG
jgi:CheY-like chemotaxis protein